MENDPPGPKLKKGCDYKSVASNARQLHRDEGLTLKDAARAAIDYAGRQGCDISVIKRAAKKAAK